MTTETKPTDLISLTAEVVSAYVAKNNVPPADVPALIGWVYASFDGLVAPPAEPVEDHTVSAAQIRKSITPDYLVSFIDGKRYKTLKRHLGKNGHTPESYRQKYGLPHDYPMVAEAYRAARSEIAKGIGLGRTRNRVLRAA